jgi:hypothetical protein
MYNKSVKKNTPHLYHFVQIFRYLPHCFVMCVRACVMWVALLLLCTCVCAADRRAIYSLEHFLDVVARPGSDIVARSAILVLHTPLCTPDNIDSRDHHLVYLVHDYSVPKRYIWFERGTKRTLSREFRTKKSPCLLALYFKKGETIRRPTETWSGEGEFVHWYWAHLYLDITVRNVGRERVSIRQEVGASGGPDMDLIYIEAHSQETIPSYISNLLVIATQAGVLDAMIVMENTSEIIVMENMGVNVHLLMEENLNTLGIVREWIWSHALRHLRNAKQPLIVQNFTETGYVKLPMPPDLHMMLHQFYHGHKEFGYEEPVEPSDGVHDNIGTEGPRMVALTNAIEQQMEDILRPQMEAWSGMKLKRTAIYGIREYRAGNLLRNHVDKLETHAISAILQVDQDGRHDEQGQRAGQQDEQREGQGGGERDGQQAGQQNRHRAGQQNNQWALEVIDYHGTRHNITLLPGQMLFYESAKLIHGRPQPFPGRRFANCFVHFMPEEGWDYQHEGYIIRSSSQGFVEQLNVLQTEITAAGKMFWGKDEL